MLTNSSQPTDLTTISATAGYDSTTKISQLPRGIAGYVGAPEHGKTYLGFQHLRGLCNQTGHPALVIESIRGESHFAGIQKAKTVEDAVQQVWGKHLHCSFTPRESEEVQALCRAVLEGKDVHFFIDEIAFWMTSIKGSQSDLTRLFRSWRHSRSTIQFTTQHFTGDIPQEVISCNPELYIFKSLSWSVAKRCEETYGIPAQEILALPPRKFFYIRNGMCENLPNRPLAQSKTSVPIQSVNPLTEQGKIEVEEDVEEISRPDDGSTGG